MIFVMRYGSFKINDVKMGTMCLWNCLFDIVRHNSSFHRKSICSPAEMAYTFYSIDLRLSLSFESTTIRCDSLSTSNYKHIYNAAKAACIPQV